MSPECAGGLGGRDTGGPHLAPHLVTGPTWPFRAGAGRRGGPLLVASRPLVGFGRSTTAACLPSLPHPALGWWACPVAHRASASHCAA